MRSVRPLAVARAAGPVMTSLNWVGGIGLSSLNTTLFTPASSGASSNAWYRSMRIVAATISPSGLVVAREPRDQLEELTRLWSGVGGEQFLGLIDGQYHGRRGQLAGVIHQPRAGLALGLDQQFTHLIDVGLACRLDLAQRR